MKHRAFGLFFTLIFASFISLTACDDSSTKDEDSGGGNPSNAPEIHVLIGATDVPSGTMDAHDFGSVIVGDASNAVTVTIQNLGTADLNLTGTPAVSSSSDEFVIDVQPGTLMAAGDEATFDVSFQPDSEGSKSSTITIANDDSDEGTYTFTVTGTATLTPEPEIHVLIGTANVPTGTLDAHDFGSVIVGDTSDAVTVTIQNLGTADLHLTGTPAVSSSSDEFVIDVQPGTLIAAGADAAFDIYFDPDSEGSKSSTITIANDDSDEGTYTFTVTGTATAVPEPEIHVVIGATDIPSGTAGAHDFGSVVVGDTSDAVTVTIQNLGNADLELTGALAVDSSNAEFVIASQPAATIADGAEVTFDLTFEPLAEGAASSTITIESNDSNEGVYTFTVTGTATAVPEPEIHVVQGTDDIASGSTNVHDFGTVIIGESGTAVTFTIQNLGTADLNLAGTPYVTSSNTEFTIDSQPSSPISDGGASSFTVNFTPADPGARTSTITIVSDDSDEGTYTFTVTGTGYLLSEPEINIVVDGDSVASGGNIDFGSVVINTSRSVNFTIQNTGNTDLDLTGIPKIEISGDDASSFQVDSQPSSPVLQGDNVAFTIIFQPDSAGTKNATIQIENNDSDEGMYQINISGKGSGCHLIKDITAGSSGSTIYQFIGPFNDSVYFYGDGLWKTDGTEMGTSLVMDIDAANMGSVIQDDAFYLAARDDGNGYDLWQSDGTDSGTICIKDFSVGGIYSGLYAVGDYICFIANDSSDNAEFWYSSGTEIDTHKYESNIWDMNPNTSTSGPVILAVIGDTLYYSADGRTTTWPRDRELYIFNNGSVSRMDYYPGYESSDPSVRGIANGYCYFILSSSSGFMWKAALGDVIYNINDYIGNVYYLNNTYWSWGYNASSGYELYSGILPFNSFNIVKDINPGVGSSDTDHMAEMDGTLYFSAVDGTHGRELWRSDGTDAGTVMVKDINAGSGSGLTSQLYVVNDSLIFIADDGIHGAELWLSDGTESGTALLKDIYAGANGSSVSIVKYHNGSLYFTANDGTSGVELWVTDGTPSGTIMVMDINPGSASSSPQRFHSTEQALYFMADDGTNGREPWIIE